MTSTSLGKKCSVCNTEVIDFTHWETKNILSYLQSSNKRVCGKLPVENAQQQISARPLSWIKFGLSVLLLHGFSSSVQALEVNKVILSPSYNTNPKDQTLDSVRLRFIDESGALLDQVNLFNLDSGYRHLTNKQGEITIHITANKQQKYEARYVGFKNKLVQLKKKHRNQTLDIVMLPADETMLGEVIILPSNKLKPIDKGPKKLKPQN